MDPLIKSEEFIGKTVGRRRTPPDSLSYASALQQTMGAMAFPRIKRGVYRFHSHEEADQWLMDRLTRKAGN